jgi:hypothetical protein
MTLEAYDPDRLDALALRLLDLCSRVRAMAQKSRDAQLGTIELHDRKPLEYLEKFEAWLYRAEAELPRAMIKDSGRRRAQAIETRRSK